MIETVMLVPTRDNDGNLFPRSLWRDLERRLLHFGGLTGTGTVRGVWRSGERTFRDTNRQFTVSLTSWKQLPEWLSVVAWARVAFHQEAIYIKVAGIPEVFT